MLEKALHRLQAVQLTLEQSSTKPLLLLPDDTPVYVYPISDDCWKIRLGQEVVLSYQFLDRDAKLVLAAVGTEYENSSPHPAHRVIKLFSEEANPKNPISSRDFWGVVYALWGQYHDQEHIPIILSNDLVNKVELRRYLLNSGLGRKKLKSLPLAEGDDEIFLTRATFWQGAGTGPQWKNDRGWLRGDYGYFAASFPATQSFTRNERVITTHPLRPPKPPANYCVYKRYCLPVRKMFTFHMIDWRNKGHMEAFHRWHNSERVSKGWGENGTMEHHIEYVKKQIEDPHVLPMIMSWDEEPMGYVELTWIKEDHVATFVPDGARDWDRGLHVLNGEDKYKGFDYSQSWLCCVTHYMFIADPRTERSIGEPKSSNPAIIKSSLYIGMHLQTSFYFPYKHSVMTMNLRERFFKDDMMM